MAEEKVSEDVPFLPVERPIYDINNIRNNLNQSDIIESYLYLERYLTTQKSFKKL